jgi:predicted nucleic acid-binding protein
MQNVAEYWNVCTRPLDKNGFGLTAAETIKGVEFIEKRMTFLPDTVEVYRIWRRLVEQHAVRGVQVHDAHLAATMFSHGVPHILTLNQADFVRFEGVEAIHPSQFVAAT